MSHEAGDRSRSRRPSGASHDEAGGRVVGGARPQPATGRAATDAERWRLVGDDAVLVELPDPESVERAAAVLRGAAPEGVVDVVPAARTVLVRGSARGRDRWWAAVRALVAASGATPGASVAPRLVRIPVVYDGDDLSDVARHAGLAPDEVVARHAAGRYRVAFGGFMPGFAYLTGLDPVLVVPRLATPRTRVPAGAVAIAGEHTAVYPRATPGGWRLLGRTDAVMFDPARDGRPALLAPGDEVRFVPSRDRVVARTVPDELRTAPRRAPAGVRAGLEVLATGPLVLVEDGGRPGLAAVGVPRSGAADPRALRAANRLVGNRGDAAALEVLLGGLVVRFAATTAVALVGAPVRALLDGRPVPCGRAVRVPAGATLELGVPVTGLRTWLAVRGGVGVGPVLGSRSTDVLSALGPAPITAGAVLPIGRAYEGLPEVPLPGEALLPEGVLLPEEVLLPADGAVAGRVPSGPGRPRVVVLAATPGPRLDRLDEASRARLVVQEWRVSTDSNRVALRLGGPALTRAGGGELPSEGLVLGAVQVPHDGRPVVFGPDHPVTGGYPVVAVLTADGVTQAAQLRPGDRVRLAVRGL